MKRYNITAYDDMQTKITEADNGEWVRYEDDRYKDTKALEAAYRVLKSGYGCWYPKDCCHMPEDTATQGMGVLQAKPGDMAVAEAQELLNGKVEGDYMGAALQRNNNRYFDYLHGRVMKVEINGETLSPWLYDRDIGQGAAQKVVDSLLEQ